MPTKIEAWQTEDGSIHTTKQKAVAYERMQAFNNMCDNDNLSGQYDDAPSNADILAWLIRNKALILEVLDDC